MCVCVCVCSYISCECVVCTFTCACVCVCVCVCVLEPVLFYSQTMMFSRHTLALLEDFKERGGGEGGATSGQAGVKSSSQKYGLVRRE